MINLWAPFDRLRLNPYPLIRPFLFCLDPEDAHILTLKTLGLGLGPHFSGEVDPILRTRVCGMDFSNPVGLAAGLDKQATRIDAFSGFGFGFIEIGGVTPKPQPGNPRPRMFRVPTAKGLINRFGFNSVGADVFVERMKNWRAKKNRTRHPVGVNLARNEGAVDDAADFVTGVQKVGALADYLAINVSCPNTEGLVELQRRDSLRAILARVMEARAAFAPNVPVFVKVSVDLTDEQQADIVAVALECGIQGIIVGNTTTTRPEIIPHDLAERAGGFSSPVMLKRSNEILANMYRLSEGKIPLIGNCGITTGEDAYAKIRAGASLVQIYTVLVYEGPLVVQKINRELAACLKRDGFASVADAVGADHKRV